jgi:solute carrier family 6 (neurotransmitter transporter), invertebrate
VIAASVYRQNRFNCTSYLIMLDASSLIFFPLCTHLFIFSYISLSLSLSLFLQSRCSIFRGTILCLCMNLTYANIVRFPRELERHGVAFLIPYLTIMLFIGVPVVLLEIALGQFLGQGSAHIWKASPFFKGASIIGRIGAWLTCIWISMQMSLGLLYMGQMSFSSVPFRQCPSTVQQNVCSQTHYEEVPTLGQRCLQKTFLRTVSDSSLNFGLLAIGLVFLWVIVMMW